MTKGPHRTPAPVPTTHEDPEITVGEALRNSQPIEDDEPILEGEDMGKYVLVGELATGGMAEVFLAVHNGPGGFLKVVVVKRVLPHLISSEDFVHMFIDEARLAARLEHPNIVRTYEFGANNGQYFTVMEYLPGEDLAGVIRRLSTSRQMLPIVTCANLVIMVCKGLHFAHELTDTNGRPLGLVHRDVNPSNIFLTYNGEAKLIDFGVAKSNTNLSKTLAGTIKGKMAYMAPEQILGQEVDRRADVFSTGVVLWEIVTNRSLFTRTSDAATLYAIMNDPIQPPSRVRREVPPALDAIVLRALSRTPEDRYQTVEELQHALEGFVQTQPADTVSIPATLESLFGSTRADAKRAIAQARSLRRNISLVMKLRTDVRDMTATLEKLRANSVTTPPPMRSGSSIRKADRTSNDALERTPSAIDPTDETGEVGGELGETGVSPKRLTAMIATAAVAIALMVGVGVWWSRDSLERTSHKAATATVKLDTKPPGAAIFVNGEPTGLSTPATLADVRAGELAIRFEMPGRLPAEIKIDAKAGELVKREITLERALGRLVIGGLPTGASIIVDEVEYLGGEVIPLQAGTHAVRVVLAGKTIVEQRLELVTGDQTWTLDGDHLVKK